MTGVSNFADDNQVLLTISLPVIIFPVIVVLFNQSLMILT